MTSNRKIVACVLVANRSRIGSANRCFLVTAAEFSIPVRGHRRSAALPESGAVASNVQREQPFEDFVVGHVFGPAVRGEDGGVQRLVRETEPGGSLVVQIGERAPGQLAGGVVGVRYESG